jgi:hypothetical protein
VQVPPRARQSVKFGGGGLEMNGWGQAFGCLLMPQVDRA